MAPLKILHVIGQRPEKTGSGIYLEAIIKQSQQHGYSNYRVAGVPSGTPCPSTNLDPNCCSHVCFESEQLDFPVTGMSDVMPYNSSLFKELKGKRLTAYKSVFSQVLEEAVKQFHPDIIHTNHLFLLTALVRKLFPHIPMVTTCHGTELRQYNNCPHLRRFVKRHCQKLDRIIALSSEQKADISRILDIPSDKIVVAGGGYDETLFTRVPKPPAGTVHILYAGKYNRSKGVPWLLKSLIKIQDQNWHLHMAGSGNGPEFNDCMALAEKLGQKVTNHGYVSHKRLAQLMKQAHIQVLPSFFEGLPLVLFEGLASGCRIITTKLTGFQEIFGKTNSETVRLIDLPPFETIDRPYKADEALLEKVLSETLLDMMAAVKKSPDFDDPQAEDIARRYTWGRIFQRVLSVYRDVVDQKINSVW